MKADSSRYWARRNELNQLIDDAMWLRGTPTCGYSLHHKCEKYPWTVRRIFESFCRVRHLVAPIRECYYADLYAEVVDTLKNGVVYRL